MKTFIKLIFLGIVTAITWQYLENNNINIKDKLAEAAEWIYDKLKEIESSSDEKEITEEDSNSVFPDEPGTTASYQKSRSAYSGIEHPDNTTIYNEAEIKVDAAPEWTGDEVEWVKAATSEYSPDSWYLLMQYDSLPEYDKAELTDGLTSSSHKSTSTFHYLEGSTRTDLISSMSIDVHEIAHGYYSRNTFRYAREKNLKLNWDNAEGFLYLSPEKYYFLSFPLKHLFPSRKIAGAIPQNLRTFRFDTYIEGNTSTQQNGIFGLLNEMHAYYLGSRHSYDMIEAFKLAEGSDEDGLISWIRHCQSEMAAFYEFDYFIREYLLLMKAEYSPGYVALKSYDTFRHAYSYVRTSYLNLTEDYQRRIDSEIEKMNNSGSSEAAVVEGKLWIRNKATGRSNGITIFSEDRETLLPILTSDRYNILFQDFKGIE